MHRLTKNVKLLQKAVLLHNDQILILQRNENAKSRPFCWDLPGGNSEWPENKLENQEDLHQKDVAREIKEESGITVVPEHFSLENLILFRTFYESDSDIYSIITGWKVVLPSDFDRDQVVLSDEHIDQKWVTFDELNEYDFGGRRGEFVKDIIRRSW
jgi:8-oxo-dGTP pyrophosphatase MutT (NUDIX family)